jgi:hypothetical protein
VDPYEFKRNSAVYEVGKEAGEGSSGRRGDERESRPGARGSFFWGGGRVFLVSIILFERAHIRPNIVMTVVRKC